MLCIKHTHTHTKTLYSLYALHQTCVCIYLYQLFTRRQSHTRTTAGARARTHFRGEATETAARCEFRWCALDWHTQKSEGGTDIARVCFLQCIWNGLWGATAGIRRQQTNHTLCSLTMLIHITHSRTRTHMHTHETHKTHARSTVLTHAHAPHVKLAIVKTELSSVRHNTDTHALHTAGGGGDDGGRDCKHGRHTTDQQTQHTHSRDAYVHHIHTCLRYPDQQQYTHD